MWADICNVKPGSTDKQAVGFKGQYTIIFLLIVYCDYFISSSDYAVFNGGIVSG